MSRLLVLLFLLFGAVTAAAQVVAPWQPVVLKPNSAGYQGPGDIVTSATFFYSCAFAYNAAYATSTGKLCNIRRLSDSETCDILAATTGGDGVTANCSGSDNGKSLATFLTSTSGVIVTKYDQTGNGQNATQATTGTQPALVISCIGSAPCLTSGSSGKFVQATLSATLAQPLTLVSVLERPGTGANESGALGNGPGSATNSFVCFEFNPNQGCVNFGTIKDFTMSDGSPHSLIFIANGASSVPVVDGTALSAVSPGTNALQTAFCIGKACGLGSGASDTFDLGEEGGWSGAFNSTQYSAMCHNQYTRWGSSFGASC